MYRRVKDPDAGPDAPPTKWRRYLPWIPVVQGVYVLTDSDGSTIDVHAEISVADQMEMCRLDDVRDGLCWTKFHAATGATSRTIKDVLSNICLYQVSQCDRIQMVPTWGKDGRLHMPPPHVLPEGYGAPTDVPPSVQRRAWQDIARHAAANPKLALVLGAAYGGPWCARLGRDSFWVHMTGASSQGKTTTLLAAAALFGDPRRVKVPWNGTVLGATTSLGELGCLTAFRDELGSMSLTVQGLETLILKTTEDNRRSTSSRKGYSRRSRPWHGALISTGNETITARISNEALAARVIEIETPILSDADTAEEIERLAYLGAGWPLAHGLSDEMGMADLIVDAQDALTIADGGVARRLDRHLVTAIAGAAMLDQIIGGGAGLRGAALEAANALRVQLAAELAERGMSPMDRLEAAVLEELAADPGAFPSLTQYRDRMVDTKISGFDCRADATPHVVVLPNALRVLGARHGIVDVTPAIRQGARDGRIITQGNRYQRAFRYGDGKVTRGYWIRIHDFTESSGNSGNSGNIPAQQPSPEGGGSGNTVATPVATAATLATESPQTSPDPAPSWTRAETAAPCVDCGQPATMRDQDGRAQHAYRLCVTAPPSSPAPSSPAPSSPAPPPPRDYASELDAFAGAVQRRYPDATPADVAQAYRVWETVTRGIRWIGTPAAVGLSWFHRTNAQHGSIPELETPPDMPELGRIVTLLDGVNIDHAPDGGQIVRGFDVNAQYLAAAGSVDCGVGAIRKIKPEDWHAAKAGYVRFEAEPFPLIPAGAAVPIPLAKYLITAYPGSVVAEAWAFDGSRRALAAWAKQVREARTALMRRMGHAGQYRQTTDGGASTVAGDHATAARHALGALKDVYAAFLGGMLRSDRANNSRALRPDWSDAVVALATANMHRAMGKTSPAPFAWRRDTAYWAVASPAETPAGLILSEQAGKWKDAGRCVRFTDAIRREVEHGSPERVNRAIIAEVRSGGGLA